MSNPPGQDCGQGRSIPTVRNQNQNMKSYEVLREAFKRVGCKNVAVALRCSLSLVYQWSRGRDGRSEARNPLEVLLRILRLTGDPRPLEWLCEQAGGRFVRGKELRALVCQDCERRIAELKAIVQSGNRKPENGNLKLETGNRKLEIGNVRCRYRRKDGRCGFALAGRFAHKPF
jgi:hypothetical protein